VQENVKNKIKSSLRGLTVALGDFRSTDSVEQQFQIRYREQPASDHARQVRVCGQEGAVL
jgi:hypothetical protein